MKYAVKICLVLFVSSILLPFSSFSQEAQKVASPSAAVHLKDNGNGTVTDTKTGLMWKKCPEGINGNGCENGKAEKFKWQFALDHVKALNEGDGYAGHKDWRVPTIEELLSLVDKYAKDPSIDGNFFPKTPFDAIYWSSTLTDDGENVACVGFAIGKRLWTFKFDSVYVRLVRGGEKKEVKKDKDEDKEKDKNKAKAKTEEKH